MKKRVMSLAVVLLMMLALLPGAAFADQYINLGQAVAGARISCFVAPLVHGGTASCTELPAGCELRTDSTSIYLEGTPAVPGGYNFVISVDSGTDGSHIEYVSCTINVLPAAPQIISSGNVNCYVGDQARLTAAASVPDGGLLSYQWYYSAVNANYGGSPIPGANSPEYIADTSSVGTTYYYCEVINSNSGQVSTAVSSPISVSVTEAVVESVMINTLPQKMRYMLGDSLDPAGISILVRYGNGAQQVVYDGFQYSPQQFLSTGQVSVELIYGGKTCSFPVTVLSAEDSVLGIGMVRLPYKTEYKQGEQLDPTGIIFRVRLANGTYNDVESGYTYAPKVLNTAGTQEITVTYMNKTCTFSVTVKAAQTENKLEIASSPGKLTYNVGDQLDTSGLVLKLTDVTGTQIIRSGFTCEPSVLSNAGNQVITVRYGSLTATFNVTVNAAATPTPGVSPSPTASAAPGESPTASPIPSIRPEHSSRSGNGVLVVIMIIALLCLVALGLYMMIMNAGGVEQFKNQLEYKLYKLKSKFRGKR